MRLNWKNAATQRGRKKGSSYMIPKNHENVGHVSKTRREYKVRFQSDIRRSKRPVDDTSSPANYEVENSDQHGSSSFEAGNVATNRRYSIVDDRDPANSSPKYRAQVNSSSQLATVEDASLLYAFSTEQRVQETTEEFSATLDQYYVLSNDINEEDNLPDDDLLNVNQEELPSMLIVHTPVSSSTSFSPQLTFQADILPNIPRELPYPSTWNEYQKSDRRLDLQYYIEKVVPRLMPLWNSADNPFLCIVIPASTESEILMHAIVALSSYHRSVQSAVLTEDLTNIGPSQKSDSLKALRHKQKVLTLLQENLTKPDLLRDDATLAACMLMQTFEVLYSGTSGWDHWLKGATLFIQLRGKLESDLKDSNSWMRMAKCVVAIETFAATSTRFDLLIAEEYWNIYRRLRQDDLQRVALGQLSGLNEYSDDEHFEKLVGCPVVVVYSLGRMVMLTQSREETEATSKTHSDSEWHNTWSIESIKLEDLLFRWRPKDSNQDKTNLAEAFRHAALVFYYRRIRRLNYCHETVQYHVKRTFDHLESLSPSSQIEGIALWPTMIAAIEIDETKNSGFTQRAIKRIRGMSTNIRDPLYRNAENALKLLWARRRDAESWEDKMAVDWEELSKEMGWKWCWV